MSVRKHRGGEIALAGVGQEDDNCFSGVLLALCKLQRCPNRGAGGNTHQEPFRFADSLSCCKGGFVFDGDNLVIHRRIQNVGNKSGSDALDFIVCPRLSGAQNGGGGRLDSDNLDIRIALL